MYHLINIYRQIRAKQEMSYANKHKKSVSPVLRTTSEDRKQLSNNKEQYIQYLEQQLEKMTSTINKKYEQRMNSIEEQIQEHEDKFENFIKLIKLLQHFAETQEQENITIKTHINSTIEQLYHQDLQNMQKSISQFEVQLFELQQQSQRDFPQIHEIEQSVNKKIDTIMDELRSTAYKSDLQEIQNKIDKIQKFQTAEFNPQPLQQQINDLKIVIDSLIQDQEANKVYLQKVSLQWQNTSTANLPTEKIKKNHPRDSSEYESVMKPMSKSKSKEPKDIKAEVQNKDRSESRKARLEVIKKKKHDKVKELIKKHKQTTPRRNRD
ncbi:hypothetical protein pb186bvf_005732 [Paramecium bursaria]